MSISSTITTKQIFTLTEEAKMMYRSGGLALVLISNDEVIKISYLTDLLGIKNSNNIQDIFKDERLYEEIRRLSPAGDVHIGLFKHGRFISFNDSFQKLIYKHKIKHVK